MPGPSDPFGLLGTLLDRRVRVEQVVAEGGFAVVYRGHHLTLDAPVAVKVLRPQVADPDEWADAVAQFLGEARTIARLHHPAVVAALDAGVITVDAFALAVPWLVLEWVEGETLQEHLARRRGSGGRSPQETLALLRPVIEAIAAAHDAGIAHRDLKANNVMLDRDGRARVLDFGIAKLLEEGAAPPSKDTQTQADVRAFSRVCAATEQLSGSRTGPWTDVYALGLLLTEVLSDAPAYPENDPTALHAAAFDPVRPTPAKNGVDVGPWEAVIARAVAIKPSERQPNARVLLEELDAALLALAPHAATQPEMPALRRSRGPVRAVVASLAVVLALAGAWAARARFAARAPAAAGSARPAAARCGSVHDCEAGSICRRDTGACVALASDDCRPQADPRALADDDTVWIGAMFPQTGPDAASFGRSNARAVDLGRRDLTSAMGGFDAHGFGVVSCDDAVDAKRAAAHLVDVGVPAVVGFRSGVEAIDLASALFLPAHVLVVSATSTNPLVTRVPQPPGEPRLVWRTTVDSTSSAGAIAAFLADVLEPRAHHALRVALVRPKDALGAAYADAFLRSLRLGGQSVASHEASFRDVPLDLDAPPADLAAAASGLLAFAPDVILFFAATSWLDGVLAPVEARWPAARRRPDYVSVSILAPALLDFARADPKRRRRVFGVSPVASTLANRSFVDRYREVYPDDAITPTDAPNTAYDAFYLLAYATYALPHGAAVTGPALAGAFGRLRGGARVEVGLAGIFDAYRALSSGGSIDLIGATGSMALDPATGDPPFDSSILCVGADGTAIESGLVYSAAASKLGGALRCP